MGPAQCLELFWTFEERNALQPELDTKLFDLGVHRAKVARKVLAMLSFYVPLRD